MNEPSAQFDAPAGQTEDLQEEVQSLRMLFCISLILMMMFGACMDCFVYKQISDLRSTADQAELLLKAAEPNLTKCVAFWNYLSDYEKTHADITPLMNSFRQYTSQTFLDPAYTPKKK